MRRTEQSKRANVESGRQRGRFQRLHFGVDLVV
jgi:hypothetical protein